MSQATFQYLAIDPRGDRTKGTVQASDSTDAYRRVVASGLKPVRISSRRAGRRGRKVTAKDLAHLTYQFAVLMEARIPIVDGLRSIAEQESNQALGDVLDDVARQIESGTSVTEAMSQHRELFGEVYVETIRAAEASGNMIDVLNKLAEMLDRQYEMSKSVKGALMYPICVISALALALVFLLVFVVPRFAGIFASRGVELPLPTQALVSGSAFIRSYWYVLIGLGVASLFSVRHAWSRPSSRQRIDGWLHRLPFLRDVLRGLAVSRFSNVFGISLRSGLSLIDALEMGGRASGRPMLQEDAEKMRDQVNTGGRLSDVLCACTYLPGFARRMLAAGEDSGEMSRMCDIVSRHYDREVTHLTKNVATVIEPIMIVGLAGVVLVVALAIFLPMWDMAALFG